MNPVETHKGDSPIVLGLPHTGTYVPYDVLADLNDRGRGLDDTDWHIHHLYDGVLAGASTVRATFHRYVVDANRDPSGVSLYPGQNTTGLVPLTDFDGHDIWQSAPTDTAIHARRAAFHVPYHAALQAELERVRDIHGIAILYDC
ncbi:MAG: N-formylglutamate amidohydrolase, partial [Yoonia sp.]|uniref:N-formylglutamate amidohydrolase n=1 Tax=Yoonia sp. TaxID=2212373 RepID=UPI003EF65450